MPALVLRYPALTLVVGEGGEREAGEAFGLQHLGEVAADADHVGHVYEPEQRHVVRHPLRVNDKGLNPHHRRVVERVPLVRRGLLVNAYDVGQQVARMYFVIPKRWSKPP